MTQNNYDKLNMHKCDCSDKEQPIGWCESAHLREQLLSEISLLQQRLADLEVSTAGIDFSMRQTCKEMIHARQQMFEKIRR